MKVSQKYKPGEIVILKAGTMPKDEDIYDRIVKIKKPNSQKFNYDNIPSAVTFEDRSNIECAYPESCVLGKIEKRVLR